MEWTTETCSFEEWLKELTAAATREPFGMSPQHAKEYCEAQPDAWRTYYDSGETPTAALTEDWSNA